MNNVWLLAFFLQAKLYDLTITRIRIFINLLLCDISILHYVLLPARIYFFDINLPHDMQEVKAQAGSGFLLFYEFFVNRFMQKSNLPSKEIFEDAPQGSAGVEEQKASRQFQQGTGIEHESLALFSQRH